MKEKKNKFKASLIMGISLALVVTLAPVGSYAENIYKEVYVPATWHPVETKGEEIKELKEEDGVLPVQVYSGKDIQNPEKATKDEKSGDYMIDLTSTNDVTETTNGHYNFMDTGELFFADKYFHVVYQADGNQYKKIEREKGKNPNNPNDIYQSSVVKVTYDGKTFASPYSEFYGDYTGLHGSNTVAYKDGEHMDLYVKAHKQELTELFLASEGRKVVYIGKLEDGSKKTDTSYNDAANVAAITELSSQIDRIEYFHPIDVASFYHYQNEYPNDPEYQDYDKYKSKNINKLINSDLNRKQNNTGGHVYPFSFKTMSYLLYDKTDNRYLTDKDGNLTTAFDSKDTVDVNSLDVNHEYEGVAIIYLDDDSEIIQWVLPPNNNLDMPYYNNTVRSRFPRMIYAYSDTAHFPIKVYSYMEPKVTVKWNDGDKDVINHEELEFNLENEENQPAKLPIDISGTTKLKLGADNKWEGNFEHIVSRFPSDNGLINMNYTLDAPDVKGYQKVIDGTAETGYLVTYTKLVNVTFDPNEGTFDKAVSPVEIAIKSSLGEKFIKEEPTRSGYKFKGWATTKDAKEPDFNSDTVIDKDMTVYAVWEKTSSWTPSHTKYTITFDLAGGRIDGKTDPVIIKAEKNETIDIIKAPTKEGYKFLYWKGSKYNPGDKYKVEGDHKFVAQWEKLDEPTIIGPENPNNPTNSDKPAQDKVPLKNKPAETSTNTGDNNHILAGAFIVAMSGIILLLVKRRKLLKK